MSDIKTLRQHLFDTLDDLRNNKIDIERARAIGDTAQTIINSAKVEVDYMKVSGQTVDSGFISTTPQLPGIPQGSGQTRTLHGVKLVEQLNDAATVTTHKMR